MLDYLELYNIDVRILREPVINERLNTFILSYIHTQASTLHEQFQTSHRMGPQQIWHKILTSVYLFYHWSINAFMSTVIDKKPKRCKTTAAKGVQNQNFYGKLLGSKLTVDGYS
jgi:hypothetical protein